MKACLPSTSWMFVFAACAVLAACGGGNDAEMARRVDIVELPVGDAHCATGGVAFTLDHVTKYACNGADGSQGVQGLQGVIGLQGQAGDSVTMQDLSPGDAHCATGGVAFTVGSDVKYVCNGAVGPAPAYGVAYTIPGSGGVSGGGYLELLTANGHVSLGLSCNYGFAGDNEAFFFAENPVVTAGSAVVTVAIAGRPLLAFNDLAWNAGGQDRAFADTGFQGSWPWQGVFTVSEAGVVTRWDVTMTGSAGADCTAIVYGPGGLVARVVHP